MAVGVMVFRSGWVALLLYHLCIVLAVLMNRDRISLSDLRRGFAMWPLLLMILIAVGGYFVLTAHAVSNGFTGEKVGRLAGSAGVGFVIYLLVVNPPLEEIFWRDLFASRSKRPSFGDLLFGCFHVPVFMLFLSPAMIPVGILLISIGGWGWRQMRIRYNGLLLPWMGHFLADLMLIAIVMRLLSL